VEQKRIPNMEYWSYSVKSNISFVPKMPREKDE
jgi:hypothetical protein